MGDFYLDDQFPEHPKALFVGDNACWMFVAGLAWAWRHNTDLIPKTQIPRLTGYRNPDALAQKLATVAPGQENPLWHDEGEYYRIHDWSIRNAKAFARRAAGKKGAEAKWKKFRDEQKQKPATADATAMRSQSDSSALALPNQPENQRSKEPERFVGVGNDNSRRLHVVRDDDEEDAGTEAIRILAELAVKRREAEKGPVGNRDAWLAKDIRSRSERHADGIRDALGALSWRPEALARHLEPEAFPNVSARPENYEPKCRTCNDHPTAYDLDEHGNATPCPDCGPTTGVSA